MKLYLTTVLIFIFVTANVMNIPIPNERESWAYSKLKQMTLDEKIGQLFILRAQSDWNEADISFLESQIKKYQIGGVAFFKGNIKNQAILTNRFQSASKIPLLIALDAEWGLGMRLEDGIAFPKQMTLGAITDNDLIYKMGIEIGRQLKRLGVDINYAPVADINTNPENPIIYDRSFGDNIDNVSQKAVSYMKGLQDAGIIACAKHFPGHGSTNIDSHLDLPKIKSSKQEIYNFEIIPFKAMVENGVRSIMTAHLAVPALDKAKNRPASLSAKITNGILRDSFNYHGLIITDALEMKGVSSFHNSAEAAVMAFEAGNDLLELPENFEKAFEGVKKALNKGKISSDYLDKAVMRILIAKYDQGYYNYKPVKIENIKSDINTPQAYILKNNLYKKSLSALGNHSFYIPILPQDYTKKIAILSIGEINNTIFQSRFRSYMDVELVNTSLKITENEVENIFNKLKDYDKVIICLHNLGRNEITKFGLSTSALKLIYSLNKKTQTYIVNFSTPYALSLLDADYCILQAYENDQSAQENAAQALLGVETIEGRMPVSASAYYHFGTGISIHSESVIGYDIAENVGIDGKKLNFKIDSIANILINDGSAPGCQVLVARRGKIIFEKCYGYTDYRKTQKVEIEDLYDMASVTKVMSTNMAVMKLYSDKKINIFENVSKYLDKGIGNSNKSNLKIIDALSHHAGLAAWIPAYKNTLDTINGKILPSKRYYSDKFSNQFDTKVAENLYLRKDYKDTLWRKLLDSPMNPRGKYKYSDLGLIIIKEMVENVTKQHLDKYVDEYFYKPLGLMHTTYKPLEKFKSENIVPTEDDKYWRNQILRGDVHDMWAAMIGGVSGHAGLFSNARDLARLSQMMLNGGYYGNTRFFDYPTVYTFTTRFYISTRRGIGWDMKELDKNKDCNISELATPSTYGHYGFTGTCVWIDPENELIFVFLSNRTFPTMVNNRLGTENYRPKIQSAIYESIIDNQ